MKPAFLDDLNQSDIVRKLRANETFPAADSATGYFTSDDRHDDARLCRTLGWLPNGCTERWRPRIDQVAGRVTVEFQSQADAEAFRAISASDAGMIRFQ